MATFTGILPTRSVLNLGDDVVSNSGRYDLILQRDGNLVLYDTNRGAVGDSKAALWTSGNHGQAVHNCVMQLDGNLVINGFPDAVWTSGTSGHPNSYFQVQDDGNVVIIEPLAPIWATGTAGQ